MLKPLSFKGDAGSKSRKRKLREEDGEGAPDKAQAKNPENVKSIEITDDSSWVAAESVRDIAGPVVIVLPTEVPSCLACDANGKVFASRLENLIDGDPATSEPHDVRQVWIALRVAGREHINFKGHHGRYLACDKSGKVEAISEAISSEESFLPVLDSENSAMFALQTVRDTYIGVEGARIEDSSIRGDSSSLLSSNLFHIRMQAQFKPKLKVAKEEKSREHISRRTLEEAVGRNLNTDEVKRLKRARKEGTYHEALLDLKVKSKHDKFA